MRENIGLLKQENLLLEGKNIEVNSKDFKNLMFVYSLALREVENKINILKDEFKHLYNYTLIDHITTRIKKPESILAPLLLAKS